MRGEFREHSGDGDGDFSPQNILEGIGWEVGTSYSRQEAWRTGLSECLAQGPHGRLAQTPSVRLGQPEWRPMEATHPCA